MKWSRTLSAYVAGFLDGDGSIYVQLKPNRTYRYRFQVAPYIVFYQSEKGKNAIRALKRELQCGYIRERRDGIIEYIIGDITSLRNVLVNILPFLRLKERQAKLLLSVLNKKQRVKSATDFLELCRRIDAFQQLNYSKKRKTLTNNVATVLKREGLLTP